MHSAVDRRCPEERRFDLIAGAVVFHPRFMQPSANGNPSFVRIEEIRTRVVPGGRSAVGLVKARPVPCLLLEAKLGVECDGRTGRGQSRFESRSGPGSTRLAGKTDRRDIRSR